MQTFTIVSHETADFSRFWCFRLIYLEVPLYLGGTVPFSTNAYFLGKDVLEIVKSTVFWWQAYLINRLIHRRWGEGFLNISLDLFYGIRTSVCLFTP